MPSDPPKLAAPITSGYVPGLQGITDRVLELTGLQYGPRQAARWISPATPPEERLATEKRGRWRVSPDDACAAWIRCAFSGSILPGR